MSAITFLGCGSMNEAILGGLLNAGTPTADITATVRRPERATELRERHGITVLATNTADTANRDLAAAADIIILGVKPVGIAELARDIAPVLKPTAVVVSVAAAVSLERLGAALNPGQPIIRTMPNTPARLGKGVISVTPSEATTSDQLSAVKELLSTVGTVVEIPETQVDALSAISGSGPAYAFYLAEAMAAAGVKLGLDPELSALLARETVAGAGFMLAEPGADATALRKAVTSPNGTTERAIAAFDEGDIPSIIAKGAEDAVARAAEITASLG